MISLNKITFLKFYNFSFFFFICLDIISLKKHGERDGVYDKLNKLINFNCTARGKTETAWKQAEPVREQVVWIADKYKLDSYRN